jgi:hypothetical protein
VVVSPAYAVTWSSPVWAQTPVFPPKAPATIPPPEVAAAVVLEDHQAVVAAVAVVVADLEVCGYLVWCRCPPVYLHVHDH